MLKIALLAVTLALAAASLDGKWEVYKAEFNKRYSTVEDPLRRTIWESNLKKIEVHNELYAKGLSSYIQGQNQFTDMTPEEIKQWKGLVLPGPMPDTVHESGRYESILPDNVDWRKKGYVTPIKNQANCGSCWAFSTTGALEGQHFKKTKTLVSLSESNLVDCSQDYGNQGCGGGWPIWAFNYIIGNKGIDTESSYPYVDEDRKCAFKKSTIGATVVSYTNITHGSEDDLQKCTATIGPISVCIDATGPFMGYQKGVYDNPLCSTVELDHAVLVVGYGKEDGKDYWLVKNSWGTDWGEKGYIKMSRNKHNQCGIATAASYPNV